MQLVPLLLQQMSVSLVIASPTSPRVPCCAHWPTTRSGFSQDTDIRYLLLFLHTGTYVGWISTMLSPTPAVGAVLGGLLGGPWWASWWD